MSDPIVIESIVVISVLLFPVWIYVISKLWEYGKLKARSNFKKKESNESQRQRKTRA